jgi:hypothetical protein
VHLERAKTPFRLVSRNRMMPPIPVVTVRVDKVGKPRGTYELHIGRVLKIEHCDRKKRKPKK